MPNRSDWILRLVVAVPLVAGAWFWSAKTRWHYCQVDCDTSDVGRVGLTAQWAVTVVGTFLVILTGAFIAPRSRGDRWVWAAIVAGSVLIANRHTLVWCSAATIVALLAVGRDRFEASSSLEQLGDENDAP